MTAIIITIGDELLIGQVIDTNSAWIAQQLNLLGIDVVMRIAIADDKNAIINALDNTVGKYDYVFITGGLGPTLDDITKNVLCEYFGGKLMVNEMVLHHVKDIFTKRNRPFLERNLKQAEVPDVCTVLFNRIGTAPGMWFEKSDSVIVSMPGVPFEMQAIMEDEVLPRIKSLLKNGIIYHKTIITIGVGESYIAEQINDLESSLPEYIKLAYLPSPGLVRLRLTAKGNDEDYIKKSTDTAANLITQRLGNVVAAQRDASLEEIIVAMLKQHNFTVTFAESCTGGYLAHRITNVSGASNVFKGSVITYGNDIKESVLDVSKKILENEGAVSEAVVLQMAKAARHIMKADISVALSGILGPDGGTIDKPVGTVWIAINTADGATAQKFNFHYGRLQNKEMAANAAFDMIRKCILQQYKVTFEI